MTSLLLFLEMSLDGVAAKRLEEDGALLESGVHLAVDKNTTLNVLVGSEDKSLILRHDSLVDGIDSVVLLAGSLDVSVDLVNHLGFAGTAGGELLDEEEVRAVKC
jgi:sulfur transfer complex TusBCD TusB component (DsrH family)